MARYHLHKHDQCNCVLDAFSSFVYANYNRFDVMIRNNLMKSYTYNFGIDQNKYSKLFAIYDGLKRLAVALHNATIRVFDANHKR